MWFFIGVLILIGFILFVYLYIKYKMRKIFGNVNFKDLIEQQKILEEVTPKSVGSMDRIYLENLERDFKDININEIKRMAEQTVLDYFKGIEKKDTSHIKSEQIKSLVDKKIQDLGSNREKYENIKFHNTVLNKYENHNGIATITIAISLEYNYQKNQEQAKRKQDRVRVEFIYIIDASKVPQSKKVLGLNCPNCGSPISNNKECEYCHTKSLNIVKRVWTCNDLKKY